MVTILDARFLLEFVIRFISHFCSLFCFPSKFCPYQDRSTCCKSFDEWKYFLIASMFNIISFYSLYFCIASIDNPFVDFITLLCVRCWTNCLSPTKNILRIIPEGEMRVVDTFVKIIGGRRYHVSFLIPLWKSPKMQLEQYKSKDSFVDCMWV